MPTPILIQTSKDLAYKLQDPVSLGTGNGQRLTAEARLGYLIRAYRRLYRLVSMLYPSLLDILFKSNTLLGQGTTNSVGEFNVSDYAEIKEVFAKMPSEEEYARAERITIEDFLSIKRGMNPFYTPDLNYKMYYWSIINDTMVILPAHVFTIDFSYRKDIAATLVYNGDQDIDIPTEHLDLLLSLACAEAYMDIGQTDMVATYQNDVKGQLEVLSYTSQKKEAEDEENF